MDESRFDRLTRQIGRATSRRNVVRFIVAGGATWRIARSAAPVAARPPGRCQPDQPDGATCGACRVCLNGACTAVADGTPCGASKGGCNVCLGGQCQHVAVGHVCGKGSCLACAKSGNCEPVPDGTRCTRCRWCQHGQCVVDVSGPHCSFCKRCDDLDGACTIVGGAVEPGGQCQKQDDCCGSSVCRKGVCCVFGDGFCKRDGDCCSGHCTHGRCACVPSGVGLPGVCPDNGFPDAGLTCCANDAVDCGSRDGCPGQVRCTSDVGTACQSDCECSVGLRRCEGGRCCTAPGVACDADEAIYCCSGRCNDVDPTTGLGVCA